MQESILSNVADTVVTENLQRMNLTIVGKEEDDYTNLQANLILYKELVNEMRDKNNLLQELLNKTKNELKLMKENRPIEQITYAGAVTHDKVIMPSAAYLHTS